jgi:UDP-2,4-diacetamido-2,4,6-trideoxy-beta-L-altropyranose hydrolase
MIITFRVDASIKIGSGHVMRCLTLADELKEQGAIVEFICREHPGNMIALIEEKGFSVFTLKVEELTNIESDQTEGGIVWLGATQERELEEVQSVLKQKNAKIDWMIVDHYSLDIRWEKQIKPYVDNIMVIDDLANRKHDCHLLLDQNFYLQKDRYKSLVPEDCVQLIGPKYALLRQEFREVLKNLRERNGEIKRILVYFGGSDPTNETQKAIDALQKLNRSDISVDIVIGQSYLHRSQLKRQIESPSNIQVHTQVNNMAKLMANADLAIGAGGSTTWERCCLGLPSLVGSIAKNQEKTLGDLATEGVVIFLGIMRKIEAEDIFKHIKYLSLNLFLLKSLALKSRSLLDGKGIYKVIPHIIKSRIRLRRATLNDCEQIFKWRNNKETVRFIFDPKPIQWEKHKIWFQETLDSGSRLLLIGEINGNPIGVLRYDILNNTAEVSLYLVPGHSGMGLGTLLLIQGNNWVKEKTSDINKITAKILSQNQASFKAFTKAGYKPTYSHFEYADLKTATNHK